MIRGEDRDDRVAVFLRDNRSAERQGAQGVPPCRLSKKLVLTKGGQCPHDRVFMIFPGTDEPPLGRNQPVKPLIGDFE